MTTKVDYSSTELPDNLESAFETALRRLRGEESPIEQHIIGGSRRTDGVMFERLETRSRVGVGPPLKTAATTCSLWQTASTATSLN